MPGQSILHDREAVTRAVSQSASMAQALRQLGLRPAGGNYRALHQACDRFGLAAPVHASARANGRRESRLPGSNGSPAPYKGAALPDELRRQVIPGTRLPVTLAGAVLVIAGLAAGSALVLSIRDQGAGGLAEAVTACLLVLAVALVA